MKVVVIGAGWSGCAAAISARKAGAEVVLYEKTDMILGLGNVGGIMRNNGRYTASEELIALGAGDLINILSNPYLKARRECQPIVELYTVQAAAPIWVLNVLSSRLVYSRNFRLVLTLPEIVLISSSLIFVKLDLVAELDPQHWPDAFYIWRLK